MDDGSGFISMYVEIDSKSLTPPNEISVELRFFVYNKNKNKYFTIQVTRYAKTLSNLKTSSFHLLRRRLRRRSPPSGMAKKKSAKGKGSNVSHTRHNSSPPSSSVSKSLSVAKQRPDSDSTAGKAASDLSPAIDAPTAAVVADPAMEIVSPNLENLATEVTVPSSTFSDTTAATNTGIETVTETNSPQDRQDVHVPSPANPTASPSTPSPAELWKGFVKEANIKLYPKEKPFLLDSGEPCVTIPNAVVEKNKKAWECFIIGQFYDEAPARGAVHAIVNGIWSKHRRDITVSKMDNQAFLFREWLSLRDSTAPLMLKRIVAHATIYSIWGERNKRLHDGISTAPPTIYRLIDRNIRDTILGKQHIKKSFKNLMLSWLRHD
ncbi:hypothetical protein DY000_02062811 [Brassica cretica]|uniref:DUF4283 domain-containing protein n=1 Tax=Brassica cretica TaxID=69181 RepID=A0ABQ7B2A6_BRACR|nr:hypothetical protein DY000_02062811 [Brassica cretica]